MVNWKTKLGGIIGVGIVIFKLIGGQTLVTEDYAALSVGLGLLFAKDHNVTGGTKPQSGGTIPAVTHKK